MHVGPKRVSPQRPYEKALIGAGMDFGHESLKPRIAPEGIES
jgi:hypothetical protein